MYTDTINTLSQTIKENLINIRREIHMYPETGYEETRTAALICKTLDKLNINYKSNIAKTGVVGIIKCKGPGKTLAIRADMDALPIIEDNNCSYKSQIHGKMHACGHDVHVASLLGAAEILSNLKDRLNGNIKLIFQPAEEMSGGALPMINEGVLKNPNVDACIAAHVWPEVEVGSIEVKHGPIMASPDEFTILIKGKGGHGAAPHTTIDPILMACRVIDGLQSIVSRNIDPVEPFVISACSIHSGSCFNVIPETATIQGTVRTLNPALREQVPSLIEKLVAGIVNLMGGKYEFDFNYLYPPTINDRKITDLLSQSASKIIGKDKLTFSDVPSMGGEDFAYFAERVPSTLFRLGSANKNKGIIHPLHSNKFDVDEDCISIASAILSQFAVDFLMV